MALTSVSHCLPSQTWLGESGPEGREPHWLNFAPMATLPTKTIAVKLLAAIREIFETRGVDRISTKDLLDALIERENDEPWGPWWEAEIAKHNTRGPAARLARLLKPFDIIPGTILEEDGSTPKGYKLALFEDAFSRYLPEKTPQSRHNDTASMNKGAAGDFEDAT